MWHILNDNFLTFFIVSTPTKRKSIREKGGESSKSNKKELKPKTGKKIGTPKKRPRLKKITKKDSLIKSSSRIDEDMSDDDVSYNMDTSNVSDNHYSEFSFVGDNSANNSSKEFSDDQLLASVAECIITQSTPQSVAQSTSQSFAQSTPRSFEIVADSKIAEGDAKKFNHEQFLERKNSSMQLTKEEINSVAPLVKPTLVPIDEKKVAEMAEKMMQEEKKKLQKEKKNPKKSEEGKEGKEGEELRSVEGKGAEVEKKSKKKNVGGKKKEKENKSEKSPDKGDERIGKDEAKGNKKERKKSVSKKRKIENEEIIDSKLRCTSDDASRDKIQDDLQGRATVKEKICTDNDDDDFIEGNAIYSDAVLSKKTDSGKEKAARKSKDIDASKKSKSHAMEGSKKEEKVEENNKKEKKDSKKMKKSSKIMKQDEKQMAKNDSESRNKEEGDEQRSKSVDKKMPKKADKRMPPTSKLSNDLPETNCEEKQTKKGGSKKTKEALENDAVSQIKHSGDTKKAPKVVSSISRKKIDTIKKDDRIPDEEKPSSAQIIDKNAKNEDEGNNKKGKMMQGKGKKNSFCVPRKKETTATKDSPAKKVTTTKNDVVSVTKMGHGSTKVGNYNSPKKVIDDLLKKEGLDSPKKDTCGSPNLGVRSSPMKIAKKRSANDKENGSFVISDSHQGKTKNPKRHDGQCMTVMANYDCNFADIKKDLFLSCKDKIGLSCSQSNIISDLQSIGILQEDTKPSPKKRIPLGAKESPVFSRALLNNQSPKKSSKTNKLKLSRQRKEHEESSLNSQDIISFEEAIHLISESSITTSPAAPRFNAPSTDNDEAGVDCMSSNACVFIDESPLVPQSGNEDLPFSAILGSNTLRGRLFVINLLLFFL